MNQGQLERMSARLLYGAVLSMRRLLPPRRARAISPRWADDAISRVYVINLDRQDERWLGMQRELRHVLDRAGNPLTDVTRRFSAVDARHLNGPPGADTLRTTYTLADQLFVDPRALPPGEAAESKQVQMTRQETAVALSHIGVWKEISAGPRGYTLVLEDDVYFRYGFARRLDESWSDAMHGPDGAAPDIVYLSYEEARAGAAKEPVSRLLFRPRRGLWFLSGYVVSQRAASELLRLLPVRGPVDLWMNYQFEHLHVLATTKTLIEQRRDVQSSNEYSILPVLAKVGLLTREKPLLFERPALPGPVFAVGEQGSGLTSLAMALSMLGYRCLSDVRALPAGERSCLFGRKKRVFDAYLNIGSLDAGALLELAEIYDHPRFIVTTSRGDSESGLLKQLREVTQEVLALPADHRDKWELISRFLGCEYPPHSYPEYPDRSPREAIPSEQGAQERWPSCRANALESDPSPWTVEKEGWGGVQLAANRAEKVRCADLGALADGSMLDPDTWILRDDTFPSNLALFRPENVSIDDEGVISLQLREEDTPVRDFTGASVCSRRQYLYGRFGADIRPPATSGVITGMFLHRNAPRQEIDVEFLGSQPTKMLVNVFYNPGGEGAKMEYGYRGTPVLIDLGFDASRALHRYEIEWTETSIRWWVDGALAHERVCWDPTPIPHLPMQFNANIWHSRSEALAGRLARRNLPAVAMLKAIHIFAEQAASGGAGSHST